MEKERKEVFETYIDKNIKPVALRWKKIKVYTRRVLQFIKQGDADYILYRAIEHIKMLFKKMNKNKTILIKNIYKKLFRYYFLNHLNDWLSDCESVLDLGCGFNSPIKDCKVNFKVGVDIFDNYLKESKEKNIHDKYIKEDIRNINFKSKSFDAVMALDVLEHLEKEEALRMLKKMENWAKKKIIISVPNGFMPQGAIDDNPFQEHRCSFEVEELKKMKFKAFGFNGLKRFRKKAIVGGKYVYFWTFISDLTQIITHRNPKLAFNLCAVKEMSKK